LRGDGIVVANIDTGVQFDHPALVGQYRGNLGGGTFDHNYNWFDPSHVCALPQPCDNNNHGTHTMGTMVGDDGGANQIGVAPHAKWIAAKGCELSSCSDSALLSSGQWVLAPTDLAGNNPRPDLRPNIVNNSWGGDNGAAIDPWYRATLTAWTAAGIFGVFSNGNAGPSCNTTGSPADNLEAFSVGAYDISNVIASFSSRGPGEGGEIRPSVAAPGVNVRSSIPGNTYGNFNGTSMAAPHVSGAVALLWSLAPALVGDITQTRQLLEDTAIDTNDLTCGGTVDDNNVFGEGRVDVLEAAAAAPVGPVGSLDGTVTDAVSTSPIAGATLSLVVNGLARTATTAADGTYAFSNLPVGAYSVDATAFGYKDKTRPANIADGATTTRDFALLPAPVKSVRGTVTDGSAPIAGATVTIVGTPLAPQTTNAGGSYKFTGVPKGTYTLTFTYGGCASSASTPVVVDSNEVVDIALTRKADAYGHICDLKAPKWTAGTTPVAPSGDDASAVLALPFSVSFYGTPYASVNVSTNGHVSFTAATTAYSNAAIPSAAAPNGAVYPEWDDLIVDASSGIYTATMGSAPNRYFVIEWRNVVPYGAAERWDFEIAFSEAGGMTFQYHNVDAARDQGVSATVGIENQAGTDALQYSLNQAVLSNTVAIAFSKPGGPF
jgi:hypothetical protein